MPPLSFFNRRNQRLAGHDLARINQFWGHYKSGNLQFLKSRSHIFYSLWKAWPVFARSGAAGSLNVAHLFRGEAVLAALAMENAKCQSGGSDLRLRCERPAHPPPSPADRKEKQSRPQQQRRAGFEQPREESNYILDHAVIA